MFELTGVQKEISSRSAWVLFVVYEGSILRAFGGRLLESPGGCKRVQLASTRSPHGSGMALQLCHSQLFVSL